MTILKNKKGTKAVNISTDAAGVIRAIYVQIYDGEEDVLKSKTFSSIKSAERWGLKKLI